MGSLNSRSGFSRRVFAFALVVALAVGLFPQGIATGKTQNSDTLLTASAASEDIIRFLPNDNEHPYIRTFYPSADNVNTTKSDTLRLAFAGRDWLAIGGKTADGKDVRTGDVEEENGIGKSVAQVDAPSNSLTLIAAAYQDDDEVSYKQNIANEARIPYKGSDLYNRMNDLVAYEGNGESAFVKSRTLIGGSNIWMGYNDVFDEGSGLLSVIQYPSQSDVSAAVNFRFFTGNSSVYQFSGTTFPSAGLKASEYVYSPFVGILQGVYIDWYAYHKYRTTSQTGNEIYTGIDGERYHPDHILGEDATVRYWPLSLAEASVLDGSMLQYENWTFPLSFYWLRTPGKPNPNQEIIYDLPDWAAGDAYPLTFIQTVQIVSGDAQHNAYISLSGQGPNGDPPTLGEGQEQTADYNEASRPVFYFDTSRVMWTINLEAVPTEVSAVSKSNAASGDNTQKIVARATDESFTLGTATLQQIIETNNRYYKINYSGATVGAQISAVLIRPAGENEDVDDVTQDEIEQGQVIRTWLLDADASDTTSVVVPYSGAGTAYILMPPETEETDILRVYASIPNEGKHIDYASLPVSFTNFPEMEIFAQFNANGGKFSGSESYLADEQTAIISLIPDEDIPGYVKPEYFPPTPTYRGYIFLDWRDQENEPYMPGQSNADAGNLVDITHSFTAEKTDLQFYARWERVLTTDIAVTPSPGDIQPGGERTFTVSVSPENGNLDIDWAIISLVMPDGTKGTVADLERIKGELIITQKDDDEWVVTCSENVEPGTNITVRITSRYPEDPNNPVTEDILIRVKEKITALLVEPERAKVPVGSTRDFSAKVSPEAVERVGASHQVDWSVEGANSADTRVEYVSEGVGKLVVAPDETADTIRVVAASATNPRVYNVAIVSLVSGRTDEMTDDDPIKENDGYDPSTSSLMVAAIESTIYPDIVIDIFQFQLTRGTPVIAYPIHYGANQRFRLISAGGPYYRIQNLGTGLCISLLGGQLQQGIPLIQDNYTGADSQEWRFLYDGVGNYRIVSRLEDATRPYRYSISLLSGQTVETVANSLPTLELRDDTIAANNSSAQWFKIFDSEGPANGIYRIETTLASNMVLDIYGASTADTAKLILYPSHSGLNQLFYVEYEKESASYTIESVNSNKLLAMPSYAWQFLTINQSGGGAVSSVFNSTNQQTWRSRFAIVKREDGSYGIHSFIGHALYVSNNSTQNGTPIIQYTYDDGPGQRWRFVKVA